MTDDTTPGTIVTAIRNADGTIALRKGDPVDGFAVQTLVVTEDEARELARQLSHLFCTPAPEETTTP